MTLRGPSKKEREDAWKVARRNRDDAYTEYNRDLGKTKESTTIRDWGEFCLTEVWPNTLREKSLISYRENLTRNIYPVLGDLKLSEASAPRLLTFFNRLSSSHLSRGSVTKVRTVLSSLLTQAVQHGNLEANPLRYVKVKGQQHNRDEAQDKRILTPDERERLLFYTSGTYIHIAVLLALKMGLRIGECLGLEWSAVDFETGMVKVDQQLQRIRGKGLLVMPPKSNAGVRSIKMPQSVREALLEARQHSDGTGFVVTNGQRKPLEPSRVRQVFEDCCWLAGLMTGTNGKGQPVPDPSFHDLRSTFLSYMAIEKNVQPRTLMQLAGHAEIGVTMKHYIRASDDHLADAMDLVD